MHRKKGTSCWEVPFLSGMGMRLFAEPHFLDQRPGFGFVAAEAHVEFHRMLGTALRKDILTERAGDLAVEDALFP